MREGGQRHRTFISDALSPRGPGHAKASSSTGLIDRPRAVTVARSIPMLDIAYLVIGAVFLGLCALYALACDHL